MDYKQLSTNPLYFPPIPECVLLSIKSNWMLSSILVATAFIQLIILKLESSLTLVFKKLLLVHGIKRYSLSLNILILLSLSVYVSILSSSPYGEIAKTNLAPDAINDNIDFKSKINKLDLL